MTSYIRVNKHRESRNSGFSVIFSKKSKLGSSSLSALMNHLAIENRN